MHDFHNSSLLAYEARENFAMNRPVSHTWFVRTVDRNGQTGWEQQAVSSNELVDLIDEALEEKLIPYIELV